MSSVWTRRSSCRLCDSPNVEKVVDLKPIPLSEGYTDDPEAGRNAERYPVDVYMCADCGHAQQLDVIDPQYLWESYTYFSGDAKGMPEHFREIAEKIRGQVDLGPDSLVIDIGSNDGSLLQPFKEMGCRVLGIDPATEVARKASENGIPTIADLMSSELAEQIRQEHGPADVVCAFNVFAHADDLGDMAESVRTMMADDGLFFFEAQYLTDIIDGLLVATIFHEHMSHHSVKPMQQFLDRHGLELVAAERAPIQHGSLIGTVQKKGAGRPVQDSVQQLVREETERGLDKLDALRAFDARIKDICRRVSSAVHGWKENGATIAAFGAARSGPTLISQFGLTDTIEYIVDDHPQKVGKYSAGDGIPIHPTSALAEHVPDYTIILAWVHAEKIIRNNQDYLDKGGRFVVLCPEPRLITRDESQKL